jgi:prephenate dehydrogenase
LREIETPALVTDVAGVKQVVVDAAGRLGRFVGGHPMAGRETAGPSGASGSMFRGATWVLTTDGVDDADLSAMSDVVRSVGASPVVMSAARHDAAVALASHVPHVTAAVLVEALAGDEEAFGLAAGGFRDLTRVALSDPGWWVDVLVANRVDVADSLRRVAASLDGMAALVDREDRDGLTRRLARSQRLRAGMAAPVQTVGVLLEDHPGEIARVGHALAASGVDLRDLQLRHAVHGGGGVLTLSVRAGETGRLVAALAEEGFRTVPST